ncbi:MAG TPA: methyltransferase domain-containing protein [Archaeoglobaceae archaeon]|nr:methyltransferase domain-containing protein [Archaeoglobaceae archaeon]
MGAGKKGKQDYYYFEAKKKGYRSRAAFKLLQINRKFRIIKKNSSVLDLGASPGGWSQVAVKLGADVVAVDLNPIEEIDGVYFIQGDINDEETLENIRNARDCYDAVICDASPRISGNWDIDHFSSIELARAAFKIAKQVLKPGGNFVVKIFQGSEIQKIFTEFKPYFRFHKFHSPQASRKRSSEVYFIGKGFKIG